MTRQTNFSNGSIASEWRSESPQNLRNLDAIKAILSKKVADECALVAQRFCKQLLDGPDLVLNVDNEGQSENEESETDLETPMVEDSIGVPTDGFHLTRDFQADVFLKMESNEKSVVDEILVGLLQKVMTDKEDCLSWKFVQTCIGKIELAQSKVSMFNVVLRAEALDESSLSVLDYLLFQCNYIQLCLEDARLLNRLARLLDVTAGGNETLNKSSKLGMLMLSILKRLPEIIPKPAHEALGQAVHLHKSFLRKVTLVEMSKHKTL